MNVQGDLAFWRDAAEHLALALPALDVAGRVRLAGARVAERRPAVGVLAALLDVQPGVLVLQRLLRADLDAAERVDHLDEAAEADLDVVVDLQPGGLLDRLHQQLGAAEGIGGVDLGGAVALDRHQRVARDRQQQRWPVAGVQDQDRVGAAAPAGVLAGGEVLPLLLRQALAAVGPDEQVGGARLTLGPVALGVGVDGGELGPRPQRDGDEEHDPGQEQDEHRCAVRDGRRPGAAAGRGHHHAMSRVAEGSAEGGRRLGARRLHGRRSGVGSAPVQPVVSALRALVRHSSKVPDRRSPAGRRPVDAGRGNPACRGEPSTSGRDFCGSIDGTSFPSPVRTPCLTNGWACSAARTPTPPRPPNVSSSAAP